MDVSLMWYTGGSAVGSDAIYQEVIKVQRAGKPVVVSMGNLAASGGYYISGSCLSPTPSPPPHSVQPCRLCSVGSCRMLQAHVPNPHCHVSSGHKAKLAGMCCCVDLGSEAA